MTHPDVVVPPPKRFEDDCDARFDPIRHRPWFHRLRARRAKLGVLSAAGEILMKDRSATQVSVCRALGIDERELRDYVTFRLGQSPYVDPKLNNLHREILAQAYDVYCYTYAASNLSVHIEAKARGLGLNPRSVRERWEIDPLYLPERYTHAIASRRGGRTPDHPSVRVR